MKTEKQPGADDDKDSNVLLYVAVAFIVIILIGLIILGPGYDKTGFKP